MNANDASAESYADRNRRNRADLRDGLIRDPELRLFQRLLEDAPDCLAKTRLLYCVSWSCGRCDLLFTDGQGMWCAVEVKRAPAIVGSGRRRKNCKTKSKRLYEKLLAQTSFAAIEGRRLVDAPVIAIGLWYEDGAWHEIARVDSDEVLGACA